MKDLIFKKGALPVAAILVFLLSFAVPEVYGDQSVSEFLSETDILKPSRRTYTDREKGLMIETGVGRWGDDEQISFDLDFPSAPVVVTSAQMYWEPKIACPVGISGNSFQLALYDHDGNEEDDAWVMWIAVYPEEYQDPSTGLAIEAKNIFGANHGDQITYNVNFPGTPKVVTCGVRNITGWPSFMNSITCPVNITSDGFSLAMYDWDGNQETNDWTDLYYIAIYPDEYTDASTGLRIETGLSQMGDHDAVSYDVSFPANPCAITCAQWGWEPMITSPVNLADDGFEYAMIDHSGNTEDNAWSFFISIYPSEYSEPATGTATPTATGTQPSSTATPTGTQPTGTATPTGTQPTGTATPTGSAPTGTPTPTGSQPTGTATPTGSQPTGTATPTGSAPTGTPTPTGSQPTGTATPTGSAPTGTPTPTGSQPTGTVTPTGTSPTATATFTPTQSPYTRTPTRTPTNTGGPMPTFTPTNTIAPIPTFTPTNTPPPLNTFTPTRTPTNTEGPMPTFTPTNTIAPIPTFTPTNTIAPIPTFTPTMSPTNTTGPLPTFTPTRTPTQMFSVSPSPSMTPTPPDIPAFGYAGILILLAGLGALLARARETFK